MANGTTKRAPTGVVGARNPVADPIEATVVEAPSCDASMWSSSPAARPVRRPAGCDEVFATGKGVERASGSGLHAPACGDLGTDHGGGRSEPCRAGPSPAAEPGDAGTFPMNTAAHRSAPGVQPASGRTGEPERRWPRPRGDPVRRRLLSGGEVAGDSHS